MSDAHVPVPSAQVKELAGSELSHSEQQQAPEGHIPHPDTLEQANGQQAPSDGHFSPSDRLEQANGQQAASNGHQQDADTLAAHLSLSVESAAEQHFKDDQRQASRSVQASTDACSSNLSHGSACAGTFTKVAPLSTACADELADSRQAVSEPEAVHLQPTREGCDQKADHQFLQALFCCPLTHVSLASPASLQCLPSSYLKLLHMRC